MKLLLQRSVCPFSYKSLASFFTLLFWSFRWYLDFKFKERFIDEKGNLFTFAFPFLVSLSKSKEPNTALAVPSKNLLLLLKLALGKVTVSIFSQGGKSTRSMNKLVLTSQSVFFWESSIPIFTSFLLSWQPNVALIQYACLRYLGVFFKKILNFNFYVLKKSKCGAPLKMGVAVIILLLGWFVFPTQVG